MAIVYLADYFTAPTAIVRMLRYDRSALRDSIRALAIDASEWKHRRDALARVIAPRPRYLEPAFFDEPRVGAGRTPKAPRLHRGNPPERFAFYQGDF